MSTTAEREYTSIGILATHVGRPVRAIEQAAAELRLQPAMVINGVAYFAAPQVAQLTVALNRGQQ